MEKLGEELDQEKSWLNNVILITLGEGKGLEEVRKEAAEEHTETLKGIESLGEVPF